MDKSLSVPIVRVLIIKLYDIIVINFIFTSAHKNPIYYPLLIWMMIEESNYFRSYTISSQMGVIMVVRATMIMTVV